VAATGGGIVPRGVAPFLVVPGGTRRRFGPLRSRGNGVYLTARSIIGRVRVPCFDGWGKTGEDTAGVTSNRSGLCGHGDPHDDVPGAACAGPRRPVRRGGAGRGFDGPGYAGLRGHHVAP
jgi:hypothetical protein